MDEVSEFVEAAADSVIDVITDDREERGLVPWLYAQPGWVQIVAGGVPGWLSGYVLAKAGRMAGTAVGGGALLLFVLVRQGYVTVDWTKLKRDTARSQTSLAAAWKGQTSTWQRILSHVCKFCFHQVN
jgi:uncharacterized membrane protein (Fun14 family)